PPPPPPPPPRGGAGGGGCRRGAGCAGRGACRSPRFAAVPAVAERSTPGIADHARGQSPTARRGAADAAVRPRTLIWRRCDRLLTAPAPPPAGSAARHARGAPPPRPAGDIDLAAL